MSTELGSKIKKLRKEKGYTLEKLAELTDSSKSYIWELENKNPPRPSAEKISKLATQLDVTMEYLLGSSDEVTEDDAKDVKFFRDYKKMNPKTKEKIRSIVALWDDSDG